jgi:5'-nucleotidase
MRRLSSTSTIVAFAAVTTLAGCGSATSASTEDQDPIDTENQRFAGKEDVAGVADGSLESCVVRKLASTADLATLDDAARLNKKAAEAIIAAVSGDDGVRGTADDMYFHTLGALDEVRFVGPKAFKQLLTYAQSSGVSCGETLLQVLAFNDFHGNLKPPSGSSGKMQLGLDPATTTFDAGGAEFLATHVKTLRTESPNTVVVAAGDIVGATPLLSAAFHDEPSIESMNLLGLEIASVGNHEFDEGKEELRRLQGGGCHPVDGCQDGDGFDGARFEYLAANVQEEATGSTLFPPYTVRRFGNNLVGFIGMTLEGTPLVTTAAGVAGLRFLDEADTANALVGELREQGVETIIVLLHEGGAQTGLYNGCAGVSGPVVDIVNKLDPAIDVVVTGHTHKAYNCLIANKIVTSGAHAGRVVSDIHLVIDEASGDVKVMTANNVVVTRDVAQDADQTALIAKYEALVAPIANRVVGSATADLTRTANAAGESALGDLLADAQFASTMSFGAQVAFMNPGGIRADLVSSLISGTEQPGEVTFGELFSVQPFGNNLIVMTITGEQLHTLLEQQWSMAGTAEKANLLSVSAGFSFTWDASRPLGDRIDPASIRLDGAVVSGTQTVRIAVNSFLADGGDGFSILKSGTDRVAGPVDLEPLEAWFTAHSPVSPPELNRVTRIGAP